MKENKGEEEVFVIVISFLLIALLLIFYWFGIAPRVILIIGVIISPIVAIGLFYILKSFLKGGIK